MEIIKKKITYTIMLFNGYDVSYLSSKTDRFIASKGKSRRFDSVDDALTELHIQQANHSRDTGSFYIEVIYGNCCC